MIHQFIELYGRSDDSQAIGIMHVCYEATDIEAVRKEYDSLGIITPQSRRARTGNLLFSIHESGRAIIEYTQYLLGSLHYNDREGCCCRDEFLYGEARFSEFGRRPRVLFIASREVR